MDKLTTHQGDSVLQQSMHKAASSCDVFKLGLI